MLIPCTQTILVTARITQVLHISLGQDETGGYCHMGIHNIHHCPSSYLRHRDWFWFPYPNAAALLDHGAEKVHISTRSAPPIIMREWGPLSLEWVSRCAIRLTAKDLGTFTARTFVCRSQVTKRRAGREYLSGKGFGSSTKLGNIVVLKHGQCARCLQTKPRGTHMFIDTTVSLSIHQPLAPLLPS